MSNRPQRVASLLKEELGAVLVKEYAGQLPGFTTVTEVRLTPDLRVARIHVSVFGNAEVRERTLEFLPLLKELGIYSMVMLTLTRDNLGQVLPLAELLRDKVDAFFFNRLAQVGEGANLRGPGREEYAAFLEAYLEATAANPIMGLKDNLTNIIHHRKGLPLFGGCTGYGCGAAFNFLTLLPDGEVHACRKLPSLIGNVLENSLVEIYDSEAARRYRSGTEACRACPIRPVCGGCLAVAYGAGLDIFKDRDPYCFL
jgi:selenobiotic family peptide radical SAM maturase